VTTAGARHRTPRRLRAAGVAVLALLVAGGWQATAARAVSPCSGPNPPASCDGGGGGDGTPTPTPTSSTLSAPGIYGGGADTATAFSIAVAPQPADWLAATHLTIQQAPSPSGPWSLWRDQTTSPDPTGGFRRFYALSGTYSAPQAAPCFRARIAHGSGTPSGWSAVKCMAPAPVATGVSVPYWVFGPSTQVTWTDNSVNDQTYYLQVTRPDGTTTLTSVAGTPGATGARSATIALRPDDDGCVTVWARDWLAGNVRYLPNDSVWLAGTPMIPTITPSAPACFRTPPA